MFALGHKGGYTDGMPPPPRSDAEGPTGVDREGMLLDRIAVLQGVVNVANGEMVSLVAEAISEGWAGGDGTATPATASSSPTPTGGNSTRSAFPSFPTGTTPRPKPPAQPDSPTPGSNHPPVIASTATASTSNATHPNHPSTPPVDQPKTTTLTPETPPYP
jgi:hypothetical protein